MNKTVNKDNAEIRAVCYARYSSDNQRDESIDAQLRAIHSYADRKGYKIVGEYIDRAKSATTDNRPEFQRMIGDSSTKSFSLVIVHKLDRFARNREDSAINRHHLRKNGVSLVSVVEDLDGSPESVLLESLFEGLSEFYSKNLSREVMKGMTENALKCQHTGGKPPLGYDVDPNTRKYVINESEEPAIKYIFKSVINGKGYKLIVRELNDRGYRTKNGRLFSKVSIYDILRNEKYHGVYIFNRASARDMRNKRNNRKSKDADDIIRIEGGVPRMISDEDFYKVQELLNGRKRRDKSDRASEMYLLSGKIKCGECGCSFSGNRKKSGRNKALYITYRCNNRAGRTSEACNNKEINRDYLEKYVLKLLAEKIFNKDIIPAVIKAYNDNILKRAPEAHMMINNMISNINKINIRIVNLTNAIADTGNQILLTKLNELERERGELEQAVEIEKQNTQEVRISDEVISKAFTTARALFEAGKLDDMQQLINLFLEEVVIYKEHVDIKINVLPFYHHSDGVDNIFIVSQTILRDIIYMDSCGQNY